MTEMYYPDDIDREIEMDQCLIEEERQMAIKSMVSVESLQWFEGTGGQTRMFANATLKNHQVHIAADVYLPSTFKTVKKYASLPTHKNLAHTLYDCFKNDKPCPLNELINKDAACRIHVDSEWFEKEFSGHSRITALVELLTVDLKEAYGFEPVIVVSNSSRHKNGQWKQSWHLTVTNASFSSNKGEMKSFMNRFKAHHQDTAILWIDGAFLVDMTVYTNYRVIRTPLSYKEEDPLKTKMMPCEYNGTEWVTRPITDEEQILDYLITHLPVSVILLPDSEQYTTTDKANSGKKTASKKRGRDTVLQGPRPIPSEVQEYMNGLLTTKGCSHSVTNSLVNGYVIKLQHGKGSRCPLLLSNNNAHKSATQYITLIGGSCDLKCHSERCKGKILRIGCLTPALLQQLNPVAESPSDCVDTPDDMVLDTDTTDDVTDEDTAEEQLHTQLTDDKNEPTSIEEEPATKKAKTGQPPKKKDKKEKATDETEKTTKPPKKDRVPQIDPDTDAINASIKAVISQLDDYDLSSYTDQGDCTTRSSSTHHVYCEPR